MKQVLAVASLTFLISVASAQIPVPDLNQPALRPSSSKHMVSPMSMHRTSHLSSMISYTGYTLGDERRTGASMIFQFSLFRSPSEAIDLLGGVMLRYKNVSDPVNESDYMPLGFRRPYSADTRSRSLLRGIRFGLGFVGLDYTVYLADGDVRPYIGFGGMLLAFPYQSTLIGTAAPAMKKTQGLTTC